MTNRTTQELAGDWVQNQQAAEGSAEDLATSAAVVEMGRLALIQPRECWDVVLEILRCHADDEWIMANLAAGPIESLLALHGDQVMTWIERDAANDPRLARILGGVWKNLMDDDVWSRLQRVLGGQT